MKKMKKGKIGSGLVKGKSKRGRKSRIKKRVMKVLKLKNKTENLEVQPLKKRGRKPKIAKLTSPVNSSNANFMNNINNIALSSSRSSHLVNNIPNKYKKDFKSPIPLAKKKNSLSNSLNLKKFSFEAETGIHFNLTDLLQFLKFYFNIDYENFILKDEQKQEFKAKINDFLKDFTQIYDKRIILIEEDHIPHFFDIILQFVNVNEEKLFTKFYEVFDKIKPECLKYQLEYLKPHAFLCENYVKENDHYKKKGGQYIKYKTIPKWHHYAWDMIK